MENTAYTLKFIALPIENQQKPRRQFTYNNALRKPESLLWDLFNTIILISSTVYSFIASIGIDDEISPSFVYEIQFNVIQNQN